MGRPRKDPSREPTTQRILQAAELAFGEKGYNGANLADIANTAGIRRPSLLYHFQTKAGLYTAVARSAFSGLESITKDAIDAPGTFDERFDRLVTAMIAFGEEHQAIAQVILRELIQPTGLADPDIATELTTLTDGLELFIHMAGAERLRKDVNVRTAVLQALSAWFVRVAAGERGDRVWANQPDQTLTDLRKLLFK